MPGSGGHTDPYLPLDVDTYLPAHKPSDQQGQHTRAGPAQPTPTGKMRESRVQPPKVCRVDVLIHFSQTSSNMMRNWCRPVAQPSPSCSTKTKPMHPSLETATETIMLLMNVAQRLSCSAFPQDVDLWCRFLAFF